MRPCGQCRAAAAIPSSPYCEPCLNGKAALIRDVFDVIGYYGVQDGGT